jgi:hypothetical protein
MVIVIALKDELKLSLLLGPLYFIAMVLVYVFALLDDGHNGA